MGELVMMRCDRIALTLSTAGCARLFNKAQLSDIPAWDAKAACKFCPVGAANAGASIAPMAKATSDIRKICPRCTRPATRLIKGELCISCYNRDREAAIGRNAKGTRPALADALHTETIAVTEGDAVVVRLAPRVATRTEAMVAMAKKATAPIAFGAPGLRWAA